jgi:ubiquinol-cytochrome c reductase cytochrome b subunit
MVTPSHIVPEWYFLPFYAILRSIPDKLLGVLAMFGSLLIMFVLPWIDRSKVRSGNFRPLFRKIYWVFILNAVVLGYVGSQPADWGVLYSFMNDKGTSLLDITVGRIATAIYFAYFPVLWFISGNEKTLPLPASISEAVLAKEAKNQANAH